MGLLVVHDEPPDRGVRDDLQVNTAKCRDVLLDGEEFEGSRAGRRAQACAAFGVAQQCHARLGERSRVARRYHQPRTADDFDDGAHIRGHSGAATEHGLDETDREAFDDAGEDDDGAGRVGLREAGNLRAAYLLEGHRVVADRVHALRLVGEELCGQRLAVGQVEGALRPVGGRPDDPQPGLRLLLADLGEGVQQRDQVLGRFDTADPDQRVRVRAPGIFRSLTHLREADASMPG